MEKEKEPCIVILDTNVIYDDFRFIGQNADLFYSSLEYIGFKLYIPKVVFDEILNKYAQDIDEFKNSYNKIHLKSRKLFKSFPSSLINDDYINGQKIEYQHFLTDYFNKFGTIIETYPKTSHRKIINRMLSGKKPFNINKEKGYKDFLIWETIIDILKKEKKPIVFITDNFNDFADNNGYLHKDLIDDLVNNGFESNDVILLRTLKDFRKKYIEPGLKVQEDIWNQLEENKYPKLNLEELINDKLPNLAFEFESTSACLGYNQDYKNMRIIAIDNIYNFKIFDILMLYPDKLFIILLVFADCKIKYNKLIRYSSEAGCPKYPVWHQEYINEEYTTGYDYKKVCFIINIVFNQNSSKVESIAIETLGKAKDFHVS